jgi:hypothetical protein
MPPMIPKFALRCAESQKAGQRRTMMSILRMNSIGIDMTLKRKIIEF